MSIANLTKVMPPPAAPSWAFKGPWEPIEAELGTALPQDYKDFIENYGRGYFMAFLGVLLPRAPERHQEFAAHIDQVRQIY